MLEVERYYRVLELEPGASLEDVHQGYLDLTWVWHPDRFAGNPRLQLKAHHKLQQLNEAHERLRSFQPTYSTRELRVKSKSQASTYPQDQSCAKNQRNPEVNPACKEDNKTTTKDCRRVTVKVHDVDEWLD